MPAQLARARARVIAQQAVARARRGARVAIFAGTDLAPHLEHWLRSVGLRPLAESWQEAWPSR